MTSKISSYIKLIRSDIRQRGWLAALSAVLFFLMMPVYTMLYLSTYTDRTSYLVDYFPGLLNGHSQSYLAAAIAVLAILAALTGFGYLHSRERLDFFHSLPVKRTTWFTTTYLSGLFIVLIPYVFCGILSIITSAVSKGMSAQLAGCSAEALLGGALAFFVIYNACVFALMLTGRTVTGLLASLAVIAYPFIVFALISSLETTFFKSYYTEGVTLLEKLSECLSPLGLFFGLIDRSAVGTLSISVLAAAVLMSALFIAAAVLLYRIYPSEAAGTAIAFPVVSPVIKVLICIPSALFFSLMIQELMMLDGSTWMFLLSLLAAVLLCAVIEFIYTMDLKLLLKEWKSSLISIAGVMAVLCFFHFDLIGYDTYIPEEDKVESISFCPDSFFNYFSYPESEYMSSVSSLGFFAPEDMTESLYTLAQSGVDNLENGINTSNVHSDYADDENNYLSAVFQYRLTGGRTVTRQYAVAYDDAAAAMKELLNSREYREQTFPFFRLDKESVTSISLSDFYKVEKKMELSKEQRDALLNAYETDLLNTDADAFINESPIGELTVYFPAAVPEVNTTDTGVGVDVVTYNAGYSQSGGTPEASIPLLYLYPEYTNTLALLEEYGYTLRTEIDPDDAASVTLYLSGSSVGSGRFDSLVSRLSDTAVISTYTYDDISPGYVYTDPDSTTEISVTAPEDIALILDYVGSYAGGILDSASMSPDYMDVQYKDGNMSGYSVKI